MTVRPPGRRSVGHARRTRPIKRASAGLSSVRAGAALAMLASAATIYGVAASSAFGFSQLAIAGERFTAEEAVRDQLAIPDGTNLFALSTENLAARVRSLPTVADATVSVGLPDTLSVTLVERVPLLVWRVGERDYMVDRDGTLFAQVGDPAPGDAASLPRIEDRRTSAAGLTVGSRLDPVDLDAATRIGSLKPADVGSSAPSLRLSVTDQNGFVVRSGAEDGWTAIFGFYTPTLRTPALIPGQVRLLKSKLAEAGEATIERIVLASDTDGTYIPKETPEASDEPSPEAAP
jgi:cell division septal protein FtsQ